MRKLRLTDDSLGKQPNHSKDHPFGDSSIATLTKSDFILGRDCPQKLIYKKQGFPSSQQEKGHIIKFGGSGCIVHKYATLSYPEGIEIPIYFETGLDTNENRRKSIELTKKHCKKEKVILFKAAFLAGNKFIRVDILKKDGDVYELIEVKAKSWKSNESQKKQLRKIKPYVEDVLFQVLTLKEALPDATIIPFLLLPDKSKVNQIDKLHQYFSMSMLKYSDRKITARVVFSDEIHDKIKTNDLMTLVNVSENVELYKEEVSLFTENLLALLQSHTTLQSQEPSKSNPDKRCFNCEYKLTNRQYPQSGFDLCWAGIPHKEHHVKDLIFGTAIIDGNNFVVNEMIQKGNVSLFDFPKKLLTGKRAKRQRIQMEHTQSQKQWVSKDLKGILQKWEYPLYFIDFETCATAIPLYKGLSPFEPIAFQWSCHTVDEPGAEPRHNEWLSLEEDFPNFIFAENLRKQIGDKGTTLIWGNHERVILRNIYNQCAKLNYNDQMVVKWLESICSDDSNRIIDMNAIVFEHYFHPLMKGRTSIKSTLPAVLSENSVNRSEAWLKNFNPSIYGVDSNNGIVNPYDLLPEVETGVLEKGINGADSYILKHISDGTMAMRAYDDIIMGVNKNNPGVKDTYRKALLRYCKLDTLAMVIIWECWITCL